MIISPAKNLNLKAFEYPCPPTLPNFLEDSQKLVNNLKRKSAKSLESLMTVNKKIATLNKERFQTWQLPFTPDNAVPAGFLFRGEVYIGLNAAGFNKAELTFAQEHLRILSGLYGLLRPLDLIQPYRLEMGTRLKINRKNDLYEFWEGKISDALQEGLKDHEHPLLVNLASDQYFHSVKAEKYDLPYVTPAFYELRAGQLKSIHVYAKRARGLMSNYIIKNRITDPEEMKKFKTDGYHYQAEHSTASRWVFVRSQPKP